MTEKINTKHIRDLLSRKSLCLESGEQMTIWLEKALDEIESLRSQLKEYMGPEEYERREEDWKRLIRFAKGQEEKAKHDLKQAEQEREEWKRKALDVHSELDLVKEDLFYEKRASEENHSKYVEQYHINTAMREVVEWYADAENYEFPEVGDYQVSNPPVWDEGGEKARLVLSRYPKEGDTKR